MEETNHLSALSSIPAPSDADALPGLPASLPPELQAILQGAGSDPEALKQSLADALRRQEEQEKFDIVPIKGYVVKTALTKSTAVYPAGTKLFINMTHSPYVPAPPPATDDEIRRAIAGEGQEQGGDGDKPAWRVPMSLSKLRDDMDKVGRACLVVDSLIHTDVYTKGEDDWDFKAFLIQLALEWVEEKNSVELSREYSLPKLRCKGEPASHTIYRPKRAGVSAVAKQVPQYRVQRRGEGASRVIKVSVQLPLLYTVEKVELDIEERKLELNHTLYALTVPLDTSVDVDSEACDAAFDKSTRTLHVTLPLRSVVAAR